jgi:GNAT superfamily N-acetyltransferase
MGAEAELVKPRFARGCRCFAAIVDGSIAGYGWLTAGPEWIGELQLEIRPRRGEGYIWNCFTLEKHRRKGIFSSLVVGICEAARQTGMRRVWIGSMAIPAEKVLAPSGFRPALLFIKVGIVVGWHLLWIWPTGDGPLTTESEQVLRIGSGLRLRRSRLFRH